MMRSSAPRIHLSETKVMIETSGEKLKDGAERIATMKDDKLTDSSPESQTFRFEDGTQLEVAPLGLGLVILVFVSLFAWPYVCVCVCVCVCV